jgi:hypothetical protein
MRVYDPRDMTYDESDNPALILADAFVDTRIERTEDYWYHVGKWADYCEQSVEPTYHGQEGTL